MSHPPRLSHAELAAARSRQDWGLLWGEAIPLVKLAVRRLMQEGSLAPSQSTEDLMQDAMLAAGLAVRRWQPEKGAFSTWVMAQVSGTVRKRALGATTGMVGGYRSGVPVVSMHGESHTAYTDEDDEGVETELQYAVPPEGLGDPADETARLQQADRVESLLGQLGSQRDRDMLQRLFGLGRPLERVKQYAARERLAIRTVRYRLASALNELHSFG